jgi:uncharacterized protein YbaP (TraB family)
MADQIYNDNSEFGKEMAAVLITKRNTEWLPKIVEEIKRNPTFIAVGAAHLGGRDSLIILLRTKGFIVEAVK